MATIEAVPELADGGFWYHVLPEYLVHRDIGNTYVDEFGQTQTLIEPVAIPFADILPGEEYWIRPSLPPTKGYCAWYMNDGSVVIRSPKPIVGVDTVSLSTADKLIADGEATRPHGRIGGL